VNDSPRPTDSPNPYQAPAIDTGHVPTGAASTAAAASLVKDFRTQIHALGGFWIFIGSLALALAAFLGGTVDPEESPAVAMGILGGLGLVWLTLGVLTCYKQLWAVYVGLVLSYLSLIGNLITLNINICGLILLIAAIAQAHRVIGWAKQMTRMGIPLTTKPQSLPTAAAQKVDFSQWK
jgi:hypothetical protein